MSECSECEGHINARHEWRLAHGERVVERDEARAKVEELWCRLDQADERIAKLEQELAEAKDLTTEWERRLAEEEQSVNDLICNVLRLERQLAEAEQSRDHWMYAHDSARLTGMAWKRAAKRSRRIVAAAREWREAWKDYWSDTGSLMVTPRSAEQALLAALGDE